MLTRELSPDFPEILHRLKRARMSDRVIVEKLAELGVKADRSTVNKLKNNPARRPSYDLGAALVYLSTEIKCTE